MNRKQAENILDAYLLLHTTAAKAATNSLKEVILDAMTTVSYYPLTISSPKTTPINIDPYKPYVTWTTECATSSSECVNEAS